jgi:hypothetical protein
MIRGVGFLIEAAAIAVIIAALANFVAPAIADLFDLFRSRHPVIGCTRPILTSGESHHAGYA